MCQKSVTSAGLESSWTNTSKVILQAFSCLSWNVCSERWKASCKTRNQPDSQTEVQWTFTRIHTRSMPLSARAGSLACGAFVTRWCSIWRHIQTDNCSLGSSKQSVKWHLKNDTCINYSTFVPCNWFQKANTETCCGRIWEKVWSPSYDSYLLVGF